MAIRPATTFPGPVPLRRTPSTALQSSLNFLDRLLRLGVAGEKRRRRSPWDFGRGDSRAGGLFVLILKRRQSRRLLVHAIAGVCITQKLIRRLDSFCDESKDAELVKSFELFVYARFSLDTTTSNDAAYLATAAGAAIAAGAATRTESLKP